MMRLPTLGFPYSISPEFLRRNQHQTLEQALDVLQAIYSLAENEGRGVVAYVSMAFGNPYGDEWSIDEVLQACDLIAECGVRQISLADTVGLAETRSDQRSALGRDKAISRPGDWRSSARAAR